jgi:hypothetical protein
VVDAPDAKLNSEYSVNPSHYHHPNLSLASGATALGSVKPRHLSQVQIEPLPFPDLRDPRQFVDEIQIEGLPSLERSVTKSSSGLGRGACPRGFCPARNLRIHPSGQHHPDHFVVADERPQRILKRGRLILFDEEMANPRRAVTRYQSQREEPPPANDNEENDAAKRDRGPDKVK